MRKTSLLSTSMAALCTLAIAFPASARSIMPMPDLHLLVQSKATSAKIFVYKMVKDTQKKVLAVTLQGKAGAKKALSTVGISKQPQYKCGYHGEIVFYNGTAELVSVEYNLDPSCAHAVYVIGKHLGSLNLTQSGVVYLKTLAKTK